MRKPKFRCPTASAIKKLAAEFSYPYNSHMQDSEYEVSAIADIEKYFEKYTTTDDDDIRFLLMEMILETSNEDKNFDLAHPEREFSSTP